MPYFSPRLILSNATVLCAKKTIWGCVLIPYYPCHGNVLLQLVGIYDGYFKENSLARWRGWGFYAYSNKNKCYCKLPRAFAGALARAATHLLHSAPHYVCGVVWTLFSQSLRFTDPLLQQRFHDSVNYACFSFAPAIRCQILDMLS